MKRLLLLLTLCASTLSSYAQVWAWAKTGGSTGWEVTKDMVTDPDGNSYITGTYGANANFAGIPLPYTAKNDVFIGKYDASGNLLWMNYINGPGNDLPLSITVDATGNCYILGTFTDSSFFNGTYKITGSGTISNFLAKYDRNGNLLWAKRELGFNPGFKIAADKIGNFYLTSRLTNGYQLSRYAGNGNLLWSKNFPCENYSVGYDLTLDKKGNPIVTGFFRGTLNLGAQTIHSYSNSINHADAYIVKHDTAGNPLWAKSSVNTTSTGNAGYHLATDANDNIYLAGLHDGRIGFDSLVVTDQLPTSNNFIFKFSPTGQPLWAKSYGLYAGTTYIYKLRVNSKNELVAAADFSGNGDLDTVVSVGAGPQLILTYSPAGKIIGVVQYKFGPQLLGLDRYDNVYVGGYYGGTALFGNISITENGNYDLGIAKYLNPNPAPVITKAWDKTLGASSYDRLRGIIPTSDNGYILAGTSNSNAGGDKSQNSQGSHDYWLVKTNAHGGKQWDKTFGGTGSDDLMTIVPANGGGYFLCGQSNSPASGDKTGGNQGNLDYWVVRVDANGNKLWDKTFGSIGEDRMLKALPLADGGVIIGGRTNGGLSGDKTEDTRGSWDIWLVRLDAGGNKVWDKTLGGSGIDDLGGLALTHNGHILVGNSSSSPISGDKTLASYGSNDYWLVVLNMNGVIQQQRIIGGSGNDVLNNIISTGTTGFLLGGRSNSNISNDKSSNAKDAYGDYWLVKIDTNLNKTWDRTYGSDTLDILQNLAQTSDGGYLLSGFSFNQASGDKSDDQVGEGDIWLVKTDANGQKIWDKVIGGSKDEQAEGFALTSDGFIVGGYSFSNTSGDKTENSKGSADYWIVKFVDESSAVPFSSARRLEVITKATIPLENQHLGAWKIYPNPAQHVLFVEMSQLGLPATAAQGHLRIVDLRGRTLRQSLFNAEERVLQYDLSTLPNGVYFVQVQVGKVQKSFKIMKQ
ncbi:putative secreted protein (Por secretion system target) [Chitinophaga skermanii]|uniref:Putative secreted protein (Por secretion system target) n=1 Tax=Chitinophaga skermanii TaxID=331697 RepID=A0A327QI87_9BACT|nr:T9SS type A sorting domain-containing protein [Chitinophaga skermanii]RAJ04011.1 putative secreted protein (Por secretion system target) [Chitinophaga skermanii]